MSVLMFLNVGDDDTARWPPDEAVERYRKQAAESGRPAVQVFDSRTGPKAVVEAVDREFRLSDSHGHGVRVMLTGYRDPALAKRLYRERGLPVNVLYSTADVADRGSGHWSHESWPDEGITVSAWNRPAASDGDDDDDLNVIDYVLRFVNDLTYDYQWYVRDLRDVPSGQAAADVDDGVYASIMDVFGDLGVQAVEPVLDAVLEQLCGAEERDEEAAHSGLKNHCAAVADGGRWTLVSGVVEEGDRAAGDAARLADCSAAAVVDYARRTTRVATSFAATFWHNHAAATTPGDRVVAECLIENLRSVARQKLDELSDEQFAMCLNAKFIATRRWQSRTGSDLQSVLPRSLFRPEIRELCEKYFAVDHLLDLTTTGDDDDSVFVRSHVEHLEPYVLPQKLVDYTSRYFGYQVRYFALTDTLVFRFTDGGRGRFVERSRVHRFAGPKNFKEFYDEAFRTIDFKSGAAGDGGTAVQRPLAVTDPNVFRYRECGYVDVSDYAVHYVSAIGDTKVRAEVYGFRDDDGSALDACNERRYRMKVECGEFWVTVQSVLRRRATEGDVDRQTELTAVMTDGTVVAVTRSAGRRDFDVTARKADGRVVDHARRLQNYAWPDGRPVLEYFEDVATVTAADGTSTSADFGRAESFVCVTYLTDGARVQMSLTGSAVRYCRSDSSDEEPVTADVKYLVCRRDLSGYEFVDDHEHSWCKVNYESPVTVVRTLTRSPFDDRTSGLVDEALVDHLMNVKTVANRLNAGWSCSHDFDGDGEDGEDDGDGELDRESDDRISYVSTNV